MRNQMVTSGDPATTAVERRLAGMGGWIGRAVTSEVRAYYAEHGTKYNLGIWKLVAGAARAGWRRGFRAGAAAGAGLALALALLLYALAGR